MRQTLAERLASPNSQLCTYFALLLFSLYQMAAHFHIIWLIIFCVTIFFFRNHLNEFRTDSKARSTSEILKAVTGSFLDPGRSYIQSDDKFHSKGVRVGETLRFQIVSVDGSGSRHLINYDEGWDVSITGVATINPELESAKEGIYTYSCVMRKAGEYCIRIEFRGVQIRGSPFKLEIKPCLFSFSTSPHDLSWLALVFDH